MKHTRDRLRRAVHLASCHLFEQMSAFFSSVPRPPAVTARALCSIDASSGSVLLAKSPDCRLPPASTVKLATALLLVRECRNALEDTVTVESRDCVRGSRMGLQGGDIVSYRSLLHGLLLTSGNDAAQVIARCVGANMVGSLHTQALPADRFVHGLNLLASELGLRRTHFLNPSGLPKAGQYTTARDLAVLGMTVFADPTVAAVARLRRATIEVTGPRARVLELQSTVDMLGEPLVVAAKTGTCPKGGANLVLLTRGAGRSVVTALLGSSVHFDTRIVAGTDRRYDDARRVIVRLHGE